MTTAAIGRKDKGIKTGKTLPEKAIAQSSKEEPPIVLTVWTSESKAVELLAKLSRYKNPLVKNPSFPGEVTVGDEVTIAGKKRFVDLDLLNNFRDEIKKPTAKICAVELPLDRHLPVNEEGIPNAVVVEKKLRPELEQYQNLLHVIRKHGGKIVNVGRVSA